MGEGNHESYEWHESAEEEDAAWQQLAAEQFLQGYGPGDEIYDQRPDDDRDSFR